MRLKRQFSPPQNGPNKMGNEVFLLEKQGKSRNIITILFNIKTKDGGRTWETISESIAFKDTTLRKCNFHKQTISCCLSIHYTNTTFHLKNKSKSSIVSLRVSVIKGH